MSYSSTVCTGLLVFTVLTNASMCSSLSCSYEVLNGNCSASNNCTNRAIVHFLNPKHPSNCTLQNTANHICKYANYTRPDVELGVKLPSPNGEYLRIPDKNMNASTNPEDASRARIGINQPIGPYKAAWCASSTDTDKWLEVNFGAPVDIEKIEIKGHPTDSNRWVEKFTLEYTNSSRKIPYNNMMTFNSKVNGSCHYIYIEQATKLRINSKSPANRTCLQLAIYGVGNQAVVLPSEVVPVDPTNKYQILDSESITNKWFLEGYTLWAVFIAVLIFLVIFTLAFLFCWCCRRDYPLKSAMEKAKDANPDYVPAWRRIDAKAEKGYIATQETQEVKIAFDDEYIPPGLQKEKQDASDEKFYKHRIFSFSGCQPANTHMSQDHPQATQENGTTGK